MLRCLPKSVRRLIALLIVGAMVIAPMPPRIFAAMMLEAVTKTKANVDARKMSRETGEFRGGNLDIQTSIDDEVCLVGPAGTGKTYAVLVKINRLMWENPGLRVLVIRKVRADLAQSVLVTWERDVLGYDNPIVQGATAENRVAYYYPNGSVMVLGGMDRPGKILSSEWDIIYAAEAVQFTENDFQMMGMRLARGSDYANPQLIADTNPDRPDHWLRRRLDAGLTRELISTHKHNPAFWDVQREEWTEKGARYMRRLNRLTGVRLARYRDGAWRAAEGAIYDEWNEGVHLKDASFLIPPHWKRYRVIDFGYTNPFVCQWWAVDPDGRMYMYREIYRTQRLVEDHAADIKRLEHGEKIEATVADHDAEDRATLARHGIKTIAANKEVLAGMQAVAEMMKVQPDGKPRLFILRGACVEPDEELLSSDNGDKRPYCTQQEIGGYVWSNKSTKEGPVKEDDHGMDAMRYMVMYLRGGKSRWKGFAA